MARPTDEKKDSTVIVRVSGEVKEYVERKGIESGLGTSGYIRDMLKRESSGIVIQNSSKSYPKGVKEFLEMAKYFQMDEETYIEKVTDAINEGVLLYERDQFVGVSDLNLGLFREKCAMRGLDAQKTLNKFAESL